MTAVVSTTTPFLLNTPMRREEEDDEGVEQPPPPPPEGIAIAKTAAAVVPATRTTRSTSPLKPQQQQPSPALPPQAPSSILMTTRRRRRMSLMEAIAVEETTTTTTPTSSATETTPVPPPHRSSFVGTFSGYNNPNHAATTPVLGGSSSSSSYGTATASHSMMIVMEEDEDFFQQPPSASVKRRRLSLVAAAPLVLSSSSSSSSLSSLKNYEQHHQRVLPKPPSSASKAATATRTNSSSRKRRSSLAVLPTKSSTKPTGGSSGGAASTTSVTSKLSSSQKEEKKQVQFLQHKSPSEQRQAQRPQNNPESAQHSTHKAAVPEPRPSATPRRRFSVLPTPISFSTPNPTPPSISSSIKQRRTSMRLSLGSATATSSSKKKQPTRTDTNSSKKKPQQKSMHNETVKGGSFLSILAESVGLPLATIFSPPQTTVREEENLAVTAVEGNARQGQNTTQQTTIQDGNASFATEASQPNDVKSDDHRHSTSLEEKQISFPGSTSKQTPPQQQKKIQKEADMFLSTTLTESPPASMQKEEKISATADDSHSAVEASHGQQTGERAAADGNANDHATSAVEASQLYDEQSKDPGHTTTATYPGKASWSWSKSPAKIISNSHEKQPRCPSSTSKKTTQRQKKIQNVEERGVRFLSPLAESPGAPSPVIYWSPRKLLHKEDNITATSDGAIEVSHGQYTDEQQSISDGDADDSTVDPSNQKDAEENTGCDPVGDTDSKNGDEEAVLSCMSRDVTLFIPSITSFDINQRIRQLFEGKQGGENDQDAAMSTLMMMSPATTKGGMVVSTPCLSARLFACFSLYQERLQPVDSDSNGYCMSRLMTLLRAMVNSEVVALGDTDREEEDDVYAYEEEAEPESDEAFRVVSQEIDASIYSGNINISSSDNTAEVPSTPVRPKSILRVSSTTKTAPSVLVAPTTSGKKRPRRIQFSGYDGSSTRPPVDRLRTAAHQHASIQALRQELLQAHTLINVTCCNRSPEQCHNADKIVIYGNTEKDIKEILVCLSTMVKFLKYDMNMEGAKCLSVEAAKSIAPNYPPERFPFAAKRYADDLHAFIQRIEHQQLFLDSSNDEDASLSCSIETAPNLNVEKKLASLLGQASRYQLRLLLNDSPPRFTPADTTYNERARYFSKVAKHIVMELDAGAINDAVDDECMSALVSLALRRLYEYFGLDDLLNAAMMRPPVLTEIFCDKSVSKRLSCFDETWTEGDVEELLEDLDDAYSFLAAVYACRFLVQLFRVQAVHREIHRLGGWSLLETYATMSWQYQLYRLCDNDAHLVLLCNYERLLDKLEHWLPALTQRVADCQSRMADVSRRFLSKLRKRKNVNLHAKSTQWQLRFAECVEQGKQMCAFPTVSAKHPKASKRSGKMK